MARDTMTYESYEPDSFDNPPKGPVGVHRGARSVMARLCPFIVVILVAALFYKDYASVFRNNKELVKSLSPSNSIVALNSWYAHNRMDNLPLVKIGRHVKYRQSDLDAFIARNTFGTEVLQ